ncbi:hypothetical protein M0Q03_02170 [bacterium]|jgi:hypothetical protein|nr:hypothetical protein [bacterium]
MSKAIKKLYTSKGVKAPKGKGIHTMMELDEHYCDVIIKRWEDYTGNKAIKL